MRSVRSVLAPYTTLGMARLAGLSGVAFTFSGLALWALFMFAFFPPSERFGGPDLLDEAVKANALFTLPALLGVLLSRWPFVSALVLFATFVGSFVAGFGWYFVLTPSPLILAGFGGFMYLVSAGLMMVAAFPARSRRDAS